jgi:hypothetical protein
VSASWSSKREAYTYSPSTYITTPHRATPVRRTSICTEERIGSLMAGAGINWVAYVARVDFAGLRSGAERRRSQHRGAVFHSAL